MRIIHDEKADAMYVYFSDREVDKTVRVSSRVLVDLDAEGNIRGLEILFASRALAEADLSHIFLQLPKVGEISIQLPVPA